MNFKTPKTKNKKPLSKKKAVQILILQVLPSGGGGGLLIIQHQRHHQHQQLFTFALLGWFNNAAFGWRT